MPAAAMLWFDNNPNASFEEKLERAAAHYQEKYGQAVTFCVVNQGIYNKLAGGSPPADLTVSGIRVSGARHILLHHFFIGHKDENTNDPLR